MWQTSFTRVGQLGLGCVRQNLVHDYRGEDSEICTLERPAEACD